MGAATGEATLVATPWVQLESAVQAAVGPRELVTELSGGADNSSGHLQLHRGALQASTAFDAAGNCVAWQHSERCSRARDRVPFAYTGEASNAAMNLYRTPWCDRKLSKSC